MRILLLTHQYLPEVGPPQLRWAALVRDFRAQGHEVHVLCPPPHYPSGVGLPGDPFPVGSTTVGLHGEVVHRVAWRRCDTGLVSELIDQCVASADSVLTAWRHRRTIRPDVVIATAPPLPSIGAGWLTALLLRRPFVLDLRDAWPDLAADARNRGSTWKQLVRWYGVGAAARVIHHLQRRTDLIVTTADSFTDVLRRRGVPRVGTVRNAFHGIEGLERLPARTRPGRSLRILYAGTVGRAHGLETAVRAVDLLRRQGVDVVLRVVGRGARLDGLSALAESLDAPVEIHGPVPRTEIQDHYAWADTLLVSLREWRGLQWCVPSKLYEGLALGLHISGSVAGEAGDIIRSTDAGFVAPPGDVQALAEQWLALVEDGPEHDPARMREWVDAHASEEVASAAYLDLLEELVEEMTDARVGSQVDAR